MGGQAVFIKHLQVILRVYYYQPGKSVGNLISTFRTIA